MQLAFTNTIKIKMKFEFLEGFVYIKKTFSVKLLINYQNQLRKNHENTNNFQNKKINLTIFAICFIV